MNSLARWIYGVCVAGSLTFVAGALYFWGAAEIRADASEVVFLTLAGAVWILLATVLFSWLGLSLRDDAVERKNGGALFALCGAVTANALMYAGGSVGEGPSYLNNVFSVGIALIGFFVLWILLEVWGRVAESITEDRDLASGIRFGGWLLAEGLVLARAVAGDWHSESATVQDLLHDGWPAALLCAVAITLEILIRPNRRFPNRAWPTYGLLPALLYLALATAWLRHLGAWEGMPK